MNDIDAARLDVAVQRNDLHRALSMTARSIGNRTVMPILQYVLIETDGERLRCSTTDLSMATTVWIGARVRGSGKICVPHALLAEVVSSLPAGEEIAIFARDAMARVECQRVGANVKATDANEFPTISLLDRETEVAQMAVEPFRAAVAQVSFAAAKDESRPVLAGIHLALDGGELRLSAADGYRMSMRKALVGSGDGYEAIVPAKALAEVARAATSDGNSVVSVHATETRNLLGFRFRNASEDSLVVTRLLDGQFPDLQRVTPTTHLTKCVVKREELARAVKIGAIFAKDGGGAIRFDIGAAEPQGTMIVRAETVDAGSNETQILADVEGAETAVALSGQFLGEYLGATRAEWIAMYLSGPTSPVRFEAVGSEADWTHVIMPMHTPETRAS